MHYWIMNIGYEIWNRIVNHTDRKFWKKFRRVRIIEYFNENLSKFFIVVDEKVQKLVLKSILRNVSSRSFWPRAYLR